ncbi:hypothetical protein EXIGLDRAFT_607590 [Exidia glandulosa HHB12029]|uniref:Uncharacterized protein n=1 Tax=Exidia glandulosa HHB12029 TaxID=1314781 RepID=A0A165LH28_EXIGL|nr:hypothetical protein EXIGLDRAFT_607590 [Exidia glandulosa HHB12029]
MLVRFTLSAGKRLAHVRQLDARGLHQTWRALQDKHEHPDTRQPATKTRAEHLQVDLPLNAPGPGGADPSPSQGAGGSLPSPFQFPPGAPWDAALTTLVGLGIVFVGGVGYIAWYKRHVLNKIEVAFQAGYDPALELATFRNKDIPDEVEHLRRREQDLIDKIIAGKTHGHYYVLLGPKGTGKGTMILDAMRQIKAEGVAILDCHPDLEVFRQRIGKAINFEYYEDSQTGLFQRRDPREGGPALDIERALNKLEKVALRYARRTERPLVLIFNNIHLIGNSDDGRNMLLQLQQKAETWAESGVCTVVFASDDFWPWFALRKTGNRMQIISVQDLNMSEAHSALLRLRRSKVKADEVMEHDPSTYHKILQYTGGRLALLNKVARAHDMHVAAEELLTIEKAWLESRIGLIPDCDDDVMDEQKWSSCSWLLLREFVRRRKAQEEEFYRALKAGEVGEEDYHRLEMPKIPFIEARQIMTRADFIEELDTLNIIAIDIHHNITPESMLILHAARSVVEVDGFDDMLDNVRDRIDEIEGLHRQRELIVRLLTVSFGVCAD